MTDFNIKTSIYLAIGSIGYAKIHYKLWKQAPKTKAENRGRKWVPEAIKNKGN